jgi:hypothetical protein
MAGPVGGFGQRRERRRTGTLRCWRGCHDHGELSERLFGEGLGKTRPTLRYSDLVIRPPRLASEKYVTPREKRLVVLRANSAPLARRRVN